MATIIVNTLSGYTNGTVNIPDYTVEFATLNGNLTTLNTTLNTQFGLLLTYLQKNHGQEAAVVPGTPAAISKAHAFSSIDAAMSLALTLEKIAEMNENVRGLQNSIATVAVHIANGVTTQQVALADQIANNKFQQQTTNAALERSNLPQTEVKPADLQTQIQTTVSTVLPVKAAISSASLVESSITNAGSWALSQATDIVKNSFIGAGAASAATTIKGWIGIKDPPVPVKVAEAGLNKAKATFLAGPGL
jgi:hypothetical protein